MPRPAVVALVALVVGCTVDPTQLVVVVHSDLTVPGELDELRVHVEGPVRTVDRGPFALAAADLPASFGVAPASGDASSKVRVEVWARRGGRDRFRTFARTSFVEHERLRLDLWLARRCIEESVTCAADEACGLHGCQDADVDPEALPRWNGPPGPDELDAGGGDAGRGDGGPPPELPRVGLLGWAGPGGDVALRAAVAGPAGRIYWLGSASGIGVVGDVPVDASDRPAAFLACVEEDRRDCWAPRLITAVGSVVVPAGLVLDDQGRPVVALWTDGPVSVEDEPPVRVDAPAQAVVLARFSPETGALDLGVALDSDGPIQLVGMAGGATGVALLALCSGTLDQQPCPTGLFLAPVDEALGLRCQAVLEGDRLRDPRLAAFGDRLAVLGTLESGVLDADGYGALAVDGAVWLAAYDTACQAVWPALRALTGLAGTTALGTAGAGGDELLFVASSDGATVDDGTEPLSAAPGEYTFVDRLDADGGRLSAAFLDAPLAGHGAVLARLTDGTSLVATASLPSLVIGVDDGPSILWRRDAPPEASVAAVLGDAAADRVTLVGTLASSGAAFEESLPPLVTEADQLFPVFYWDFAPPRP